MKSRALTIQLSRHYMVLSGLTSPRSFLRVVCALAFLLSLAFETVRAQPGEIAGTMPEDYLPELKEILKTAAQQSPDAIAREFDRLTHEARLLQINAARLPQVGGTFSYGITETATNTPGSTTSRSDGFFYVFGLSQPVWHWGALKNQSAAGRISVLVAEKSFAMAYRELSVILRKAYLALIAEKAGVRFARESRRLIEKDIEIATARKESGTISAAALEGERLRLRENTVEVERLEAEFAKNRSRFARLAGLPPDFPEDKIPDNIPPPVYSPDRAAVMTATLLRDHAKSTLEYEFYELRIRDAMLRQKIERTRNLPKFGLSAQYQLENNTVVNGNNAEQVAIQKQSVGLGGSWNIWDSFATRGVKREAAIARRAAEHKKATEIEALLQNAQTLERALKITSEQLALAEIRRGMAAEVHQRVSAEVGFGNVPKNEIARAQVGILQAEAKNLEMRAVFLGQWSEFVALTSEDPVLNNLPARYVRAKK